MPKAEVASRIRSALDDIKRANLKDPQLGEVLGLAEQLANAMKMFFSSLDNNVTGEFRYIADYIKRTRDEISELRPNDIHTECLPSAGAELDAVVKDTETATETIMHASESVLELEPGEDPDAYKAQVDEQMMKIIEACSFQDITGQRVSKVVRTLMHIEERISHFAAVMGVGDAASQKTEKDRWREANLLNGPQAGGPATKQDDIDALFANDASDSPDGSEHGEAAKGGKLGQDDIDSLFD